MSMLAVYIAEGVSHHPIVDFGNDEVRDSLHDVRQRRGRMLPDRIERGAIIVGDGGNIIRSGRANVGCQCPYEARHSPVTFLQRNDLVVPREVQALREIAHPFGVS